MARPGDPATTAGRFRRLAPGLLVALLAATPAHADDWRPAGDHVRDRQPSAPAVQKIPIAVRRATPGPVMGSVETVDDTADRVAEAAALLAAGQAPDRPSEIVEAVEVRPDDEANRTEIVPVAAGPAPLTLPLPALLSPAQSVAPATDPASVAPSTPPSPPPAADIPTPPPAKHPKPKPTTKTPARPAPSEPRSGPAPMAAPDTAYIQSVAFEASCSSCGGGGVYMGGGSGCAACGQSGCMPGAPGCLGAPMCAPCNDHNSYIGRLFCEMYRSLCCPDPCYEPRWVPAANAAFFQPSVRPQSRAEIRWHGYRGMRTPDRSEYFFARPALALGRGTLPLEVPMSVPFVDTDVEINELVIYNEAGIGKFGTYVEQPYRSWSGNVSGYYGGFGDLKIGTKSMLLDTELLQATFQMETQIPIGLSLKGLGTGHMALEPSLLIALKLDDWLYLQSQLGEWIPLGGDFGAQGSLLEWNTSLNAVLWQANRDVQLIGTLELNTWSFQDGTYIDPTFDITQIANDPSMLEDALIDSAGQTYWSMGPGLRLAICSKMDFGVGTLWGPSEERRWAWGMFRAELRWFY